MLDPFQTLGLAPTANEQEIRARYLSLVRQFPPDSSPLKFAEIHAAYDDLSDPRKRLEQQIFELSKDSLSDVIAEVNATSRGRISVDDLLSLGS